jgi:hypothetical protein
MNVAPSFHVPGGVFAATAKRSAPGAPLPQMNGVVVEPPVRTVQAREYPEGNVTIAV